jgi:transketolase N-terminal domain/subunit
MACLKRRDREPGAIPVPADLRTLEGLCGEFRRDLLDMTKNSGTGSSPIGGSLSAVEILAVLTFTRCGSIRIGWSGRDVTGSCSRRDMPRPSSTRPWRGGCFFSRERLFDAFNRPHSIAQVHVTMETRNAEIPTGPLGMGLAGVGMAWASRYASRTRGAPLCRVFAVLSDGECTSGQTWEAAMAAAQFELENVLAIVDYNKRFLTGPTDSIMSLEPFARTGRRSVGTRPRWTGTTLRPWSRASTRPVNQRRLPGSRASLLRTPSRGTASRSWKATTAGTVRTLVKKDYAAAMQEVSDGNQ